MLIFLKLGCIIKSIIYSVLELSAPKMKSISYLTTWKLWKWGKLLFLMILVTQLHGQIWGQSTILSNATHNLDNQITKEYIYYSYWPQSSVPLKLAFLHGPLSGKETRRQLLPSLTEQQKAMHETQEEADIGVIGSKDNVPVFL